MQTQWNVLEHSDEVVIAGLDAAVRSERRCVADVLAHMGEVDARRLYAERGYSSMFRYAVEHLGYSEGAAGHRITAARLAKRFPVVLERAPPAIFTSRVSM